MSDFTDAFFLRGEVLASAIALLQAAKVPGYVFPAENGWIPIVFSRGARIDFENLELVIAANPGILLHYTFANDHGCAVALYERNRRLGRIRAMFETADGRFDRDGFLAHGLLTTGDAAAIDAWIACAHDEATRGDEHFI